MARKKRKDPMQLKLDETERKLIKKALQRGKEFIRANKVTIPRVTTIEILASRIGRSVDEVMSVSRELGLHLDRGIYLDASVIKSITDKLGVVVDFEDDVEFTSPVEEWLEGIHTAVGQSPHPKPPQELSLIIDPGDADPDLIADILSDLSILYKLKEGGSGISFELKRMGKLKSVEIDE